MINVRDFGAVGDGVTDDRAAIQAALDAGGWVYVPEGTYALVSGLLRINARTRLTLSPGATILRKQTDGLITNEAESQPGAYNGNGSIIIEGGIWDANADEVPAPASAMGICHATNVTIRDLAIWDVSGYHAIELNSMNDALVDNCKFRGFFDPGDRNFSEAVQIDAAIDETTGFAPYDGTVCDDVEVRSCWAGPSVTKGMQSWPRLVGTHSVPATQHRNIRIHDNYAQAPTWAAIRAYWWDRATIADNQIVSADGYGIAVQYSSRYVEVHDNQIFDSAYDGILVSDNCTQINIHDNDIVGSGRAANNTYGGVHAKDSNYLRIHGNTIRRRVTSNNAKYGLWVEGSCSSIQRYGNDCRYGGATSNLYDASPSPITSAGDAA